MDGEVDVSRDPKLAAIRDQIGPIAWGERVEQARARASIVRAVLDLQAEGRTQPESLEMLGAPVEPGLLREWTGKYRRGGLAALIDRSGHVTRRRTFLVERTVTGPARPRKPAASFLKWAGAKSQSVPAILKRIPAKFGTYYEPMVGSGCLFLALRPERAVLGDSNAELMNCYRVIRDRVGELCTALDRHANTYEHFIATRALDPESLDEVERAARTIYLNKTCYNGLYRVNRKGRFNSPYGWSEHANFKDFSTLHKVRDRLQGVTLVSGPYEETIRGASAGDLIYFDPPYLAENRRAPSFTAYQADEFSHDAHRRLAGLARELAARGCTVLLSNSDLPEVHTLYRGFDIEVLPVTRKLNRNTSERSGWREVLIHFRPPAIDWKVTLLAVATVCPVTRDALILRAAEHAGLPLPSPGTEVWAIISRALSGLLASGALEGVDRRGPPQRVTVVRARSPRQLPLL